MRLLDKEAEYLSDFTPVTKYIHQKLPTRELSVLKELLLLQSHTHRKAILKHAFLCHPKVLTHPTPSRNVSTPAKKRLNQQWARHAHEQDDNKGDSHQRVLPGRFMDILAIMKDELVMKDSKSQAQAALVLDIWLDSCNLLEEIAAG